MKLLYIIFFILSTFQMSGLQHNTIQNSTPQSSINLTKSNGSAVAGLFIALSSFLPTRAEAQCYQSWQNGSNVPVGSQLSFTPATGSLIEINVTSQVQLYKNGIPVPSGTTFNSNETAMTQANIVGGANVSRLTNQPGCPTSGGSSFQIVAPMPVELIHFIATCEKNGQQVRYAQLNRETASEVNNDGFWVQKSIDGKTWVNVAFVKGAGNSSQTKEYGFVDTERTEGDDDGVVYYRLEQNDFDGTKDYSDVVALQDCDDDSRYEVSISPNPVIDKVTVSISNQDNELAQTIYIINSLGQVIGKVSAGDANKVEIDMSNQPNGVYYIKTISGNGDNVVTTELVKI